MFLKKDISLATVVISVLIIAALSFSLLTSFDGKIISANADSKSNIIILDAGHGGEDSGAIGTNGVYEKDLNLEISTILGEYLEKAGFLVVYTRTEDCLLYTEEENIKGFRKIYDLKNRVAIANSYENAIFVSIHMNSFSDGKYSGLQVYYSKNDDMSYALASNIQSTVKQKLQPNNNRKQKEGDGLYLLDNSTIPAVLIECGFLSNAAECEKLCKKEYQKELSFSIVCGIINYIERTKI